MTRMTVAVLGGLALMMGAAFAAPAPNDVGTTGMGGGVYYNPFDSRTAWRPVNKDRDREIGTTGEGGGVYRSGRIDAGSR
jgi:hypothetical protein